MNDTFYRRFAKRWLDSSCAIVGLILLSPLLIVVALAVKLTSRGPALFRQARSGQFGVPFHMVKFRTMRAEVPPGSSLLTAAGDGRITPLGAWLRKTKIDELPQLINVLAGDMSLVGPRPEVPKYTAIYSERQKRALLARPGMTCPSIDADEESVLARQTDAEAFYLSTVLPAKLDAQLAYTENICFQADVKAILATVSAIFLRFRALLSQRSRTSANDARRCKEEKIGRAAPADPN